MTAVVADTHALVWYLYDSPSLSSVAREAMDVSAGTPDGIYLSAISLIELTYLVEKGRLSPEVRARVWSRIVPGGGVRLVHVDENIAEALATIPRSSVPDLPDRIIAATAVQLDLPLVSRDGKIRASEVRTIW